MKAIILLMFIATLSYSQSGAVVNITNVTDTVNVGDSIKINFTYNTINSGNIIQIMLINNSVGYSQNCLNQDYNSIYTTQPRCYNDIDGSTYLKVKITSNMGTGDLRVYSNDGSKYSYIRSTVGIKEYSKDAIILKAEYYDIYGKEKPSTSEGLTIKATTFSNGYVKKEKIIIE